MLKLKKMLFILLLLISIAVFSNTNDLQRQYRIGYTTEYANGLYNSDHFISKYNSNSSFKPTKPKPRRSPERPYSGGWLEDLEDWARMKGWGLIYDENWPSYVDEDYWEEFLSQYPEYEDEAETWFYNHNQTPPWKTPVGDMPWILGGMMIMVYIIRYKCKE